MIRHKKALHEIFEAERIPQSGKLYDVCDVVLVSAGVELPREVYKFIALGDYYLEDIVTGDLTDKYVIFYQDIVCGAIVQETKDGVEDAEDAAYELARLVRTLLKANKTLVSTTYPTGAAKTSSLSRCSSEAVIYFESQAHVVVITLKIKMQEAN